MDRKADPCTDFYEYACGTWIREHPADPGFVRERFVEGDDRNVIYFEKLVSDTSTNDPDVRKAQLYRASCMDVWAGNDADLAPVQALLDEIDGVSDDAGLATTVADLHGAGVSALFRSGATIDEADPTARIFGLSGGGWSLPTKESYGGVGDLTASYEEHVTKLAPFFGLTLDAPSVVGFEAGLAGASSDVVALRDALSTWNPADAAAFEAAAPGFDFATYFDHAGYGTISRVTSDEPAYFTALSTLLSSTPLDVVKQYLKWRVLEATANYVSRTAIDEESRFHDTAVFGRSEQPDWWECFLATRSVFSYALAKEFVARFVEPDTRSAAKALVENIRKALHDDVTKVAWLDEPTRSSALGKLENLLAHVGYPDQWPSYASYGIAPGASFLENRFAVYGSGATGRSKILGSPVSRDVWTLSPATTNAVYSPELNSITVPVAILEDPFYSLTWPIGLNLAILGSIVGHEMTHGFDDQGRHFDANGALTDWWTDSVDAEFKRRAQCLVDQYGAYEPLPGVNLDGSLTLGENIADLGGVRLAYSAYEAPEKQLPTTAEFTPEQEFFLAYAQIWCASESDQALENSIATDPHSPPKYRVNGVVRNIPAFAKAFHCSSGGPLTPAPADRCELW